ncbi:putative beta-lactamase HcpC precursor, partial [Haemophilus influenzae]
MKLTK